MIVVKISYLRKTTEGYYMPTYFYSMPVLVASETKDTVTVKFQGNLYTFPKTSVERFI